MLSRGGFSGISVFVFILIVSNKLDDGERAAMVKATRLVPRLHSYDRCMVL